MGDWSNKHAIMRDLAEAQGFDVPVDLEGIGANEKPPALNIPEDTGEDYFGHCVGEADTGPPDIALIQQMLDVVRDVSVLNCEDSSEYVVEISKPNRLSMSQMIGKDITNTKTGTIPKTIQSKTEKPVVKKVKKKRENVAVNSILQNMAEESAKLNAEQPKEPLKLLKPMDFITDLTDTEIVESVEKVNGWLDNQVPQTYVPKFVSNPLHFEAGTMFKRKSGSTSKSNRSDSVTSSPKKKVSTSYKPFATATKTQDPERKILHNPLALDPGAMFKRRSGSTAKSTGSDCVEPFSPPQKPPSSSVETYQPTTNFSEYYQKYVEKNQIKESIKDDIWTRAEKLMKKKEEAAALKALESKLEAEAILSGVFDVPTKEIDLTNTVRIAKLEPDVNDATIQPAVTDATVQTAVNDATIQPDLTDATVRTALNDATIQPAATDATIQFAVTETTRQPTVIDVTVEPVETDATIQPAVTDATVQTAVNDATIQPAEE